jgi:hypothetical protein
LLYLSLMLDFTQTTTTTPTDGFNTTQFDRINPSKERITVRIICQSIVSTLDRSFQRRLLRGCKTRNICHIIRNGNGHSGCKVGNGTNTSGRTLL